MKLGITLRKPREQFLSVIDLDLTTTRLRKSICETMKPRHYGAIEVLLLLLLSCANVSERVLS